MIETIFRAYLSCDPTEKCRLTQSANQLLHQDKDILEHRGIDLPLHPGRPQLPLLVHPRELSRRGLGSVEGRAALWHALAHIEFNAINLALDAILRFPDLPAEYYQDWLKVAAEEAYHFSMIRDHLNHLGFEYGSFSAHNSLWELAEKTAHDPIVRMGLVPRVMEARGLDVTPGIMQKLSLAGDEKAEAILSIILRDEIGHVSIGNRWFKYLCAQRNLAPLEIFDQLAVEYLHTQLKGPYDRGLRLQAGFDNMEVDWLESHYP